jgi:hypothetical protein
MKKNNKKMTNKERRETNFERTMNKKTEIICGCKQIVKPYPHPLTFAQSVGYDDITKQEHLVTLIFFPLLSLNHTRKRTAGRLFVFSCPNNRNFFKKKIKFIEKQ